ncbi:MAG: hypothetical protein JWR39_1423, partial [Devosia sp.]|nr:hypothetical protein [Devosia sp.]
LAPPINADVIGAGVPLNSILSQIAKGSLGVMALIAAWLLEPPSPQKLVRRPHEIPIGN